MTKQEFIEKMDAYLEETGLGCGSWNSYMSVGDDWEVNTSITVDDNGVLWISKEESVKRIKTTINVSNVKEFRYSQFGRDGGRFFVICDDYSGLDFCEGELGYFENGYFGKFKHAIEWFTEHPVE